MRLHQAVRRGDMLGAIGHEGRHPVHGEARERALREEFVQHEHGAAEGAGDEPARRALRLVRPELGEGGHAGEDDERCGQQQQRLDDGAAQGSPPRSRSASHRARRRPARSRAWLGCDQVAPIEPPAERQADQRRREQRQHEGRKPRRDGGQERRQEEKRGDERRAGGRRSGGRRRLTTSQPPLCGDVPGALREAIHHGEIRGAARNSQPASSAARDFVLWRGK